MRRNSFSFKDRGFPALCPGPLRNRQVPRVPSPGAGVTCDGEVLSTSSMGFTPSSSLLRTHVSVPSPPTASACAALCGRSWQVAVSPCWERHLPDAISANPSSDAWTPTPAVLTVHLLVSSREASAFPELKPGRHTTTLRTATSVRWAISGLQSFANVQASKFARPPGRSHRRGSDALWAARAFPLEQHTTRYLLVCRVC